MKDLVIIGNLAYQTEYLLNGEKHERILGSAFYCSVAAKLIPAKVGLVSRVGTDCQLSQIKKLITDLSGISVITGQKTARFTVYEKPGTRIFSEKPGASKYLKTNEYPVNYYQTKHVHLASMHPQNQLKWLIFLKKELPKNTTFSADAFETYTKKYPDLVIRVFQKVDLAFLNQEELNNLKKYRNFVLPQTYILKKGNQGASYINKSQKIKIPALKIKTVNTTGAGEILATVFLLLRSKGIDLHKSLNTAVFIASKSVSLVDKTKLLEDKSIKDKLKLVILDHLI